MAFVVENDIVVSFAEFQDVVARDQRLFDANEGLFDDVVENLLIRATERILSKLRSTDWWRTYYVERDNSNTYNTVADIPEVDPNKILDRQNDFTDLCVYTAMSEFLLPLVADFGDEDSAERQKMGYYSNKAEHLFLELVKAGDWYDFDGDNVVESREKDPGKINLKRVR